MATKYVAGTAIKTIQHGSRSIVLEYVSETTDWRRITIAKSVLDSFTSTVEKSLDSLRPDTAYVAMKETEHVSDNDKRSHFSVLELNGAKHVTASRHMIKK